MANSWFNEAEIVMKKANLDEYIDSFQKKDNSNPRLDSVSGDTSGLKVDVSEIELDNALRRALTENVKACNGGNLTVPIEFNIYVLMFVCAIAATKFHTAVLCDILDADLPNVNYGDVVSVLHDLKDDRSIESLARASNRQFKFDEYHHQNWACISALGHIGSEKSKFAIEYIASNCAFADVRDIAKKQLDLLSRKSADI
jgi:hypothetical protein